MGVLLLLLLLLFIYFLFFIPLGLRTDAVDGNKKCHPDFNKACSSTRLLILNSLTM